MNSSKRKLGLRQGLARGSVSTNRKFNFISKMRVEQLKTATLKRRTEAKMNWGVKAYNEWRDERLHNFNYDVGIYYADLRDLANLKLENLRHALCYFIPEVTKSKGEGLYPGHTLYQLCMSIQKYLNVNKIPWKIVEGVEFEDVKTVLDNVMKERTALNIGVKRKQAQFISYQFEEKMWERGVLGEDCPDRLRDTVLFLIGTNCMLRASDEHYFLRRDTPTQGSQLTFELSESGHRCLVYREDTVSKTHDGGLKDMRSDRKENWVFPNSDRSRCCVRLVEKYLKLCPQYYRKSNFYLQSLPKPTPSQWYGEQVVGQATLAKTVKCLFEEADIAGYFTNHSCRRSGTTRLFQAGVDRKLFKEATGHRSDAVDCYAVTSEAQRQAMSKILCDNPVKNVTETVSVPPIGSKLESKAACEVKPEMSVSNDAVKSELTTKNLGCIIDEIASKLDGNGKTTIKIQIEITKE